MFGKDTPNKSFDRSANSAAFIRETRMLVSLNARPVNSSVRPPERSGLMAEVLSPLLRGGLTTHSSGLPRRELVSMFPTVQIESPARAAAQFGR
jgi:hypothetical protein